MGYIFLPVTGPSHSPRCPFGRIDGIRQLLAHTDSEPGLIDKSLEQGGGQAPQPCSCSNELPFEFRVLTSSPNLTHFSCWLVRDPAKPSPKHPPRYSNIGGKSENHVNLQVFELCCFSFCSFREGPSKSQRYCLEEPSTLTVAVPAFLAGTLTFFMVVVFFLFGGRDLQSTPFCGWGTLKPYSRCFCRCFGEETDETEPAHESPLALYKEI